MTHALARRDHRFGECRRAFAAAAILRHRRRPVRGDARHQLRSGEIGAQPFAGLELRRLDQRVAVASLAACEPGERAFGGIDVDVRRAPRGLDLAVRQPEMLPQKRIDRAARRAISSRAR